jgi:hypothetical protein
MLFTQILMWTDHLCCMWKFIFKIKITAFLIIWRYEESIQKNVTNKTVGKWGEKRLPLPDDS